MEKEKPESIRQQRQLLPDHKDPIQMKKILVDDGLFQVM